MADVMPDARAAWLERVLGFSMPAGGVAADGATNEQAPAGPAAFRDAWADAADLWRDASDAVDGQIAKLTSALRGQGDEWLSAIAEFGLNALTGNHKVRLMAGIMETTGAGPEALAAAAARTRAVVSDFTAHLAASKQVAACDANPFGVAMSIRATLAPALERLGKTLDRAA